jgi:hypothetical protein
MMGLARDCANRDTLVYPGSGPSTLEVTPLLPALFLIISIMVTMLLELFGLEEEEEEEGSDLRSLRVQTPLYRQGSDYRLGGRLPGYQLLCGHGLCVIRWAPHSSSDGSHFIKWLSPLDRHLGGISSPFCLGSFRGEGSCLLVGGVWTWLASCPSFASVDLVGARPLSVKRPLEESCHLRRLWLSSVELPAGCWRSRPFGHSWSS